MCSSKLIMFTVILTFVMLVSADCPAKCHCTRYKTFCNLARLNTLPSLLPTSTVHLKIEADHISVINTSIITHSGLHCLSHLQLVNVHLREIQPGAFQNMSQLQYLQINYNSIEVLKTNSFKYLENLYFLNLSNNGIHHLEPGTFSGLSNLTHLDITHNHISPLKANVFDGMKINTNCDMMKMWEDVVELDVFHKICSLAYFKMGYEDDYHIPNHISDGLFIDTTWSYEIIFKGITHDLYGISYLLLRSGTYITNELKLGIFKNLKQLIYLDNTEDSLIDKIQSGAFEGLILLKVLILNNNRIHYLNNGTFRGLDSLKRLEIAYCEITTIEINAFKGLSKLEFLDLSRNPIDILKNNTFSGLHMLKQLNLNEIKQIDGRAFSDLRNVKSLSITHVMSFFGVYKTKYDDIYENINNYYNNYNIGLSYKLNLFNTEKEIFLNLARLDSLEVAAHMSLPKDMQVLKLLQLYFDDKSVNPQQELKELFQTVNYVKELEITLLHINSTQFLSTLSDIRLSSLTLLYSDIKYINNNNLTSLTKITMYFNKNYTIQQGAFQEMKSLTQLALFYESHLHYGKGSFHGLHKLKQLSIMFIEFPERFIRDIYNSRYEVHMGTFQGLQNLKRLELSNNGFICVEPGALLGLYKIKEIYLNYNNIGRINAGVFGAVCEQEFELSCKNVTLPQYCNNTNALTTLQYLNLAFNKITYIHPHAFIACNNLHTLDLRFNEFLTLDISFLITPALRKLDMSYCNVTNISHNTFECTPLLSDINFSNNNNLNNIKLNSLLHLKHLQIIDISYTHFNCNCELYETWLWMRQHHVHYIYTGFRSYTPRYKSYCGATHIDIFLSTLDCNMTLEEISVRQNVTITRDDFEFFKQYIEPLVLIIILIFGVTCNGFLLFISLHHSDMRTKQNTLVIHLAIVDVISLILNLPLSYWDTVNVTWQFDHTLCKIFILTKDMMVGVVVSNVVALSIERFIVAKTFKSLKKVCISERIPTTWLVLMTWICAIVTSLPAYFSAAVVDARCLYCPPKYHGYIRNVWTFQLVTYCLIPAAAITFLNIKTSLFLRESVRKIPGEKIKNNIKAKNRIIAANIVLILAVVFIISYLPNHVLRVLVGWSFVDMENVLLPSFFTFCLFFCNTVFNPISLFIMSSKFKSYALSYFPFLVNQQNT